MANTSTVHPAHVVTSSWPLRGVSVGTSTASLVFGSPLPCWLTVSHGYRSMPNFGVGVVIEFWVIVLYWVTVATLLAGS